MVYRAYERGPRCHDEVFYKDREPADHINQAGYHRNRLITAIQIVLRAVSITPGASSIGDYGCGTAGLLNEVRNQLPDLRYFGYDMSPQAIEFGRASYGLDTWLCDFTSKTSCQYPDYQHLVKSKEELEYPDILVMTETLEHLVDPHTFVYGLRHTPVRTLVASVPDYEGPLGIGEHHLWAWTDDSFPNMFKEGGYTVVEYFHENSTQYVLVTIK